MWVVGIFVWLVCVVSLCVYHVIVYVLYMYLFVLSLCEGYKVWVCEINKYAREYVEFVNVWKV